MLLLSVSRHFQLTTCKHFHIDGDHFYIYVSYKIYFIYLNRLKINKGVGIETYHYLNDGLWQMKPVK